MLSRARFRMRGRQNGGILGIADVFLVPGTVHPLQCPSIALGAFHFRVIDFRLGFLFDSEEHKNWGMERVWISSASIVTIYAPMRVTAIRKLGHRRGRLYRRP